MAKPPIQVYVSSSDFKSLLDVQKVSLENVSSMKQMMEKMQGLKPEGASDSAKVEEQTLAVKKELVTVYKDELKSAKEIQRTRNDEAKAISNIAKGMQTFKTIGDRMSDMSKRLKDNYGSMSALKVTALKTFNIGGIFNKSIEKEKFIQTQRKLGSEDNRKTLSGKFEGANRSAKNIKQNEEEFSKLKADSGLSESQLAETKKGKELLSKREQLSSEYAKNDLRANLVRRDNENPSMTSLQASDLSKTPSSAFAAGGQNEEAQIEQNRMVADQTNLLTKIEENTRGGDAAKPVSKSEEGGGFLGGLGKSLKSLGTGIGRGLGAILSGIGRGLMTMAGGLVALTPAIPVIGVLTLAAIGLGKALQLAAPAIEAFAPVLMKIAEVVGGVFIKAIETIPAVLKGIGDIIGVIAQSIIDIMDQVVTSIERLSKVDGSALLSVAGGLLALSGAMIAFGGAQAIAGVGNLVSNLLSVGSDSPVEQLIKIGQNGEGVIKAAEGLDKVGVAMIKMGKIDKKSMEAINDFPWLRATAFVAAGGAMSVDGTKVYNASKGNADENAKTETQSGGGNTNVVNAPVTNNSNTTQIISSPIRNQESSQSRYLQHRYADF